MENIAKELSAKAYIYNMLINLTKLNECSRLKMEKAKELSHKVIFIFFGRRLRF
jgi:hypothetical protein